MNDPLLKDTSLKWPACLCWHKSKTQEGNKTEIYILYKMKVCFPFLSIIIKR